MKKQLTSGILLAAAISAVGCAQSPSTAAKKPAAKTEHKLYVSRNLTTGSHIPAASSYDADVPPSSNVQTLGTSDMARMGDSGAAALSSRMTGGAR